MIGVLGHLILLSVGYIASLFFAPPEKSYRAMTLWGWMESKKLNRLNQLDEAKVEEVTPLGARPAEGGRA